MHKGLLTTAQVFAAITAIYIPIQFESFFILGFLISALNIISIVVIEYGKKNEVSKKVVIGWGIYLIFGGLFISGILTLIGTKDYEQTNKPSISKVESKLNEIDDLLAKGIITKEEYDSRRKNILERI